MTQKLTAIAVIGANLGDEGKGLMTDALAHSWKSGTVIRYNGGCQAGHTVTTPDGITHVFSHIGSGTFVGADTYLSRFFISNPRCFNVEHEMLKAKIPNQKFEVFVHKDSLITTPWDEIINQFLELGRGQKAHGSVGRGINETVERSAVPGMALRAGDLKCRTKLAEQVMKISTVWLRTRIKLLTENGEFAELSDADKHTLRLHVARPGDIAKDFLEQVEEFLTKVKIVDRCPFKNRNAPVIFEGAQGLMLDQKNGTFPYVTRSNTGVENIMKICDEEGLVLDEAVFVTRHYMTRHGNGPLPHEGEWKGIFLDDTNIPHPFQGTIRTALLDWRALADRVRREEKQLNDWRPGSNTFISVAITHCNTIQFPYQQLGYYDAKFKKWYDSPRERQPRDFYSEDNFPFSNMYYCMGKTRDEVWSDIFEPFKAKLSVTPQLLEIFKEELPQES